MGVRSNHDLSVLVYWYSSASNGNKPAAAEMGLVTADLAWCVQVGLQRMKQMGHLLGEIIIMCTERKMGWLPTRHKTIPSEISFIIRNKAVMGF